MTNIFKTIYKFFGINIILISYSSLLLSLSNDFIIISIISISFLASFCIIKRFGFKRDSAFLGYFNCGKYF